MSTTPPNHHPNPTPPNIEPPKKPWYKKWWGITLIVLGVLGVIGTISGNSQNQANSISSSGTAKATPAATTTSATPGLNQAASDGKFQFTVTGWKCGVTQVVNPSDTDITDQPQGQYCLMDLTVKNIGTQAQSFDGSSQYVYDAGNKQYSYASGATSDQNGLSSQFDSFPTINPGVSISGTLVFDVPTTTTITYAMLHDSSLSNGVKVKL